MVLPSTTIALGAFRINFLYSHSRTFHPSWTLIIRKCYSWCLALSYRSSKTRTSLTAYQLQRVTKISCYYLKTSSKYCSFLFHMCTLCFTVYPTRCQRKRRTSKSNMTNGCNLHFFFWTTKICASYYRYVYTFFNGPLHYILKRLMLLLLICYLVLQLWDYQLNWKLIMHLPTNPQN